MELPKTFDPKSAEDRWAQLWIDRGYFKAGSTNGSTDRDRIFSIVFPPPNVTGQLHLGHALNVTLHDIIVRMRRMQGYNTLWLPGTDHAGIATQNVVERELAKEGLTRHDLGREAFVARVWEWRETYGRKILKQLQRLGASCDWSRERFTLDPGLSRAVNTVFVDLYKKGLIYRERALINWCPRCETALSDLEVDRRETTGSLWHIRYPFADGSGSIIVATTRPETMLGDTAVAVNPDDPRYSDSVGKLLSLPLTGREIPVIADSAVDREFGTGAVKVTPAHDFADFDLGRRHNLAQISVMDTHARMNLNADPYSGLTREEARKRIVADLETLGRFEKIEPHKLALGVCSRCDTVVEPMLSFQWFVRTKSLAEDAIRAVRDGDTTFHPKFWENTYFNWMENIHDWCISRQLWWGHRIPAYTCGKCGEITVLNDRPDKCKCGGANLKQEDDVLDTWFSSALWPFSTLGWPDENAPDFKYYPTSLLITGFDIIFFWVARMMMMGLFATKEVPFTDVYITPLVRDQFGKKMTKSRGNVVDPLEIMDRYGTDAVRFTLAQLSVQGRDLILSDDRLAASRAFANKIWNAARFVLMNLEGAESDIRPIDEIKGKLTLADRWLLDQLEATGFLMLGILGDIRPAESGAYEFNIAALAIYQFVWHEFCDWYIELAKEPLRAGGEARSIARSVLVHCLDQILRLLHPFMPFLTEEIWQTLRPYIAEENLAPHLVVANFPKLGAMGGPSSWLCIDLTERKAMKQCVRVTETINSLRSLVGHHPGARIKAVLRFTGLDHAEHFQTWREYAMTLGKLASLNVLSDSQPRPAGMIFSPLQWGEVGIAVPDGFDYDKARANLKKKLDETRTHLQRNEQRYANPGFRAKADPETVAEIENNIERLKQEEKTLESQLATLD